MQSKIDLLDQAAKSNNKDETISSSTSTTDGFSTYVYLGSKKEETTVLKFTESSKEKGLTYLVFRKMLEVFLNKYYQEHKLPQERYLEIHGDQQVMFKALSFGTAC